MKTGSYPKFIKISITLRHLPACLLFHASFPTATSFQSSLYEIQRADQGGKGLSDSLLSEKKAAFQITGEFNLFAGEFL